MTAQPAGSDAKAERRRSQLVPALAFLCALSLLLGLGFWQLRRMEWKNDLLARLDERLTEPAIALPAESDWPHWSAGDEFRRITLHGVFVHDAESPVYGSLESARGDTTQGYFLLTPLRLDDGSAVFIDRGFIPRPLLDKTTRPDTVTDGTVVVTGIMHAAQKRGWFTPQDDTLRNLWFTRDPEAMALAHAVARAVPFYVQAETVSPSQSPWPKPGPLRPDLPNNHLQYALTWFGLAGALTAVFVAFAMRRARENRERMTVPSPRQVV